MAWSAPFLDGADHYATADLGAKYENVGTGVTVDSSIFRNSGKSIRGANVTSANITKFVGAARNFVVGFGVYLTSAPLASSLGSASGMLLGVSDALNAQTNGQIALILLSDGLIHAARANLNTTNSAGTATELAVSLATLSINTWHYIEIRGFIDNTNGQLELRINGTVQFNLTGLDTQNQTFNNFHCISLHQSINSTYFDDIYIRTSNENTPETGGFLGDIKIKPYYPNGDGTYSAMTPSSGSTHYTLVDEANPTTTDYVSSNTALQKDSYTFQDVSETGSVKAVQLSVYAAKDDAGFRGLDLFVKSSATEDFATSQPLSTTPKYQTKSWDKDPNTAADWSQANLNAAEFGQRTSADL